MSEQVRAFLALELPAEAKVAAAQIAGQLRERMGDSDVKWVASENLHITLRFLGDLSPEMLERAQELVRSLDGESPALESAWNELGAFPSVRRPSVIWLGLEDAGETLGALAREVNQRLVKAGFGRADKPFRAHVTLGRVRRGRRVAWPESDGLTLSQAAFSILAITLFRSRLTPHGPVYTPIETAHLFV